MKPAAIKRVVLLILLFPTLVLGNEFWGQTGHRVTGQIAENHLKGKTKRALEDLLDGQSLAFVSTFGDDIKADRAYDKYGPWHYVNYPLGMSYTESPKNEEGDIITAIEQCTAVIRNRANPREQRAFHLKMLVHLIGDLHQPMHASRAEDKGGNDIQVQWFGKGSNLHKVWDSQLIDSYGMTFSELAGQLDNLSKAEVKAVQQGTILDWVEESHAICAELYASVEIGDRLGYAYSYNYNELLFAQLQKGGLRLAKILNGIFA